MEEHSQWSAGDVLKFHDSNDGPPMVMYFQTREEVVEAANETQWSGDDISRYSSKYNRANEGSHPGGTSIVVNPSVSNIETFVSGELFNSGPEVTPQEVPAAVMASIPADPADTTGSPYIEFQVQHRESPAETNTRWEILPQWLRKFFPTQRPKNTPNDSLQSKLYGNINPPVPPDYMKTLISKDIYGNLYTDIDMKNYKYALVFSSITNFNPSGVWVVEDLYHDSDL